MKDLKSLLRSFIYAFKGLGWMISHERNFRIHLTFLGFMTYFLVRFDYFILTGTQIAILVLTCALVLASEMINTAIEKTNDTATKERNEKVKVAKDVAAGAVLIFAVASIIVGVSILWQPEAFKSLYTYFTVNPLSIALLVAMIVISLIFIFKFDFNKKEKK